ncbi:OprO/OprP family phosphate-selective porin [Phenylobacterium sp.]|uniref:OprO/OprP family phosphate-selective porin n=1 Tax=Phenylobacterium sp. TaxID=1871053 RepID=UPI002C0C2F3F|nr:porin [Phenylobacterium sp.]HLZ74037.1 porin [Phenylobacterium sp.]
MATKRLLLAASALSLLASTAHAQVDPRDAEIEALRAQVQALAAKLDQLQARIDAPAAPAVIQTPATAAPSPAIATIVAGKPSIASADGQFTANLHAVVHFDAADYSQAGAGPLATDLRRGAAATDTAHARDLSSGTDFRRARIGIDGRAFGDWDYNVVYEFGGAGEEDAGHVYEMWIQYSGLKPFHARIGAFAPSYGLDDQDSTNSMLFLERAAVSDVARGLAGGDSREGAEIWANGDRWYFNTAVTGRGVGVVNSQATGISQPFDSQLSFIGRLGFLPVRTDNAVVELGVHGSYIDRPADTGGPDTAANAVRYGITLQERPELRVDGTRLISTGAINSRHADTAGLEAAAQFGSLFLQSEYESIKIERMNPAAGVSDPDFHGYYLDVGYILTGEKRRFNATSWAFDGPAVNHPFSLKDRTWGAFEVGARYSDLNLNYHAGAAGSAPAADAVRGGEQEIWTGGLNWYPNSFVRFMLDYQDVRIDRLSPSALTFSTPTGAEIGQHYHVVELRSQFAF